MADHLLPGITATRVETPRLTQQVLAAEGTPLSGPGDAVLFVHGNVSSSLFWQQPLLALAETGRVRALAVDLRGYGGTDPAPVDASRGLRDWADDLAALVDTLGLDRVHLVGWSMGGGVVMQYLLDHPDERARLGAAARRTVERFMSVEHFAARMSAWVEGARSADDADAADATWRQADTAVATGR